MQDRVPVLHFRAPLREGRRGTTSPQVGSGNSQHQLQAPPGQLKFVRLVAESQLYTRFLSNKQNQGILVSIHCRMLHLSIIKDPGTGALKTALQEAIFIKPKTRGTCPQRRHQDFCQVYLQGCLLRKQSLLPHLEKSRRSSPRRSLLCAGGRRGVRSQGQT